MHTIHIGDYTIGKGADRLTLISGPCVAESLELCRQVAAEMLHICRDLGINYVFKTSFDKANRTSAKSYRGIGLDGGLDILKAIKEEFGVPVLTDIHEPGQAAIVANVADVLQIPAFLCRQTDLVSAAADTGKAVNVKKGQFMAPWDMANVIHKITEVGNHNILLTERGVCFGYNTLVVDMTSLPAMRELGFPVCFDGTHSVQLPGGAGTATGGRREYIPSLVRAAVAVGIDALFMEVHPNPPQALSDSATQFPLSQARALLTQAVEIDRLVREAGIDQ